MASNGSTNPSPEGGTQQNDPVLPPVEQARQIFAKSRYIWQSYLEAARSMHHISPESLELSHLANRLPALPNDLKGVTFLQGYSTLNLEAPDSCSLRERTTATQRWKTAIVNDQPTICQFSAEAPFSEWQSGTGPENRATEPGNGIFIMLAGWAYVLSKNLLEKKSLSMHFTASLAPLADSNLQSNTDGNCITVDIGEVTPDERLWWRALLASAPGFEAPQGQLPPWAITYEGPVTFRVAAHCLENDHQSVQPPSSSQALRFLSRFSARHNLGTQSSATLAMALTLPLHSSLGPWVFVPKPKLGKACTSLSTAAESECPLLEDLQNLSRYMTLSSNPRFLSSALLGIFWEPGVDCNAVTPWFDGIIEVLEPLVNSGDFELIGHILALRRPKIAPLWYGIILLGQTVFIQYLIPFLQTLRVAMSTTPIPDVAYWTGVPQSFMDLPGSGPYLREGNKISRADVWRLRNESWEVEPEGIPFQTPPLLGWPPFGTMRRDALEIEVHNHVVCGARHRWRYDTWTWMLENRAVCEQYRAQPGPNFGPEFNLSFYLDPSIRSRFHLDSYLHFAPDYEPIPRATRIAFGVMFYWAASEMEFPDEGIYTHKWVGICTCCHADNSPNDTISSPSISAQTVADIEWWLERVPQYQNSV